MFTIGSIRTLAATVILFAAIAHPGFAQTEDVEPRIIARARTTLLGISGSLSRFFSTEDLFPGNYTVQIDAHRFIVSKVAIRFGVVGSGTFSDSASDDTTVTTGTATVDVLGGALYYFTPESMWSLYAGGEYRARLLHRVDGDTGSVVGTVGLQGAISSRTSFFLEAGYGMRLRKGDSGELLTRMVGQVGVRIKF
jgi:hypothetical protein